MKYITIKEGIIDEVNPSEKVDGYQICVKSEGRIHCEFISGTKIKNLCKVLRVSSVEALVGKTVSVVLSGDSTMMTPLAFGEFIFKETFVYVDNIKTDDVVGLAGIIQRVRWNSDPDFPDSVTITIIES